MILSPSQTYDAFAGLGAFGNADWKKWCDEHYGPNGAQPDETLLKRCKKECSGIACVTTPGLLSPPWAALGAKTRGIPYDVSAKTITSAVTKASTDVQKAQGKAVGPGGAPVNPDVVTGPSPGLFGKFGPFLLPIAIGAVAAVVIFKKAR